MKALIITLALSLMATGTVCADQSDYPYVYEKDLSGIWYNLDYDGSGLVMQNSGHNLTAFWYTYDDQGNQLWLVGSINNYQEYSDGTKLTFSLYKSTGGRFGVPVADATNELEFYGHMFVLVWSCDDISVLVVDSDPLPQISVDLGITPGTTDMFGDPWPVLAEYDMTRPWTSAFHSCEDTPQ